MKKQIDQICRFDMHPAFVDYECPFIKETARLTNNVLKTCKELNCPMYVEITSDDYSDKTPQ